MCLNLVKLSTTYTFLISLSQHGWTHFRNNWKLKLFVSSDECKGWSVGGISKCLLEFHACLSLKVEITSTPLSRAQKSLLEKMYEHKTVRTVKYVKWTLVSMH